MQIHDPRRFLVVMQVTLIADDLAEILRETVPGAEVLIAGSPAEAVVLLQGATRLDAAFLEFSAKAVMVSGLVAQLQGLGAQIVMMRDDRADGFGPSHKLDMPFTAGSVAELLAAMV